MNTEVYDFFKKCEGIKTIFGGCVMVAINKTTGYGCNGIFQIVESSDGFSLVKKAGGMIDRQDFDFESILFSEQTIINVEFGVKFGEYANVYIDDSVYIHIHIKILNK